MDPTRDNTPVTATFTDDGTTGDPAARAATRRRRRWAGAVVVIAAAAITTGVLVGSNLASAPGPAGTAGVVAPVATATSSITSSAATPSAPPATAAAPPATSAAPPAAATSSSTPVPPAEEWKTFTSGNGKVSFDYPAQWTVTSPPGAAAAPAVDVDVADESGLVVASLHYGPSGGIGGACQGPVPYRVLDSVELALPYNQAAADTITPRFTFRALLETGRVTASYGITSSAAGRDGTTCMFYNVVSGPPESPLYSFADAFQVNAGGPEEVAGRKGAKTFPSLDAARAYMGTAEYRNAKRMITSLKINAG